MVKKVVGYDENDKKVFEREAREYDKAIGNSMLGISVGDILKAIPVIVACGIFYANDINFKKMQLEFNDKVLTNESQMTTVLNNLNTYLSAKTGLQFKDGLPR